MPRTSLFSFLLLLTVTIGVLGNDEAAPAPEPKSLAGEAAADSKIVDAGQYESLQAAIDAVPAEGGTVSIPPGRYEITTPLVIGQSDLLIQGSGTATHIVNLNEDGEPALSLSKPGGTTNKREEQQWRVQLSNMRITGNPASGAGIYADRVNEIYLEGLTVSENGKQGIVLDFCYEDPRIADCLVTYNKGTGILLQGCHDIVVSATHFEENIDALQCLDGFNLCMTGNNIDDHLGNGVVIEQTYGSVLSGNMIEECREAAIIVDRDCYGITFSANVIAHNGSGIDLRDAHGCAVSANTFTVNRTDSLRIGPNSGRITVTGNNFSNSFLGGGEQRREGASDWGAGLVLEGTSDIAISGNVFSKVKPKALELRGGVSRRVVFSNNVLTDVVSDHERLEDSIVENNLTSP